MIALESTIISHGFPYPANVECAFECERIAREEGVVPATVALIGGRLRAGLAAGEIEYLGSTLGIAKASRRDIPVLAAAGADGATTVAGTMLVAALAGIRVFATGGLGGVHRGAASSMDISADLLELGRTEVAVVCAGAKSVLDLTLTLEVLETQGVPVIGYQTDEFPAFYTRTQRPLRGLASRHARADRRGASRTGGAPNRRRNGDRQPHSGRVRARREPGRVVD